MVATFEKETQMKNVIETLKASMNEAAKKAGITLDVEIESCTMDQTWGYLVGLFFSGPHAERAATYFAKWNTRERLGSCYEAQHSPGEPEAFTRSICKGVRNFRRGEFTAPDYCPPEKAADYVAQFELTKGFAVSYVYFPCAE
jgi:hypothetical protein